MKKLAHILVIIFLLVSTCGFTIDTHYCGNTLMATSLDSPVKSCCGSSCPMMKHAAHKSCRTVTHIYKVQAKYISGQRLHINPILSPDFLAGLLGSYVGLFPFASQDDSASIGVVYRLSFYNYHLVSSGGFRAPPFAV